MNDPYASEDQKNFERERRKKAVKICKQRIETGIKLFGILVLVACLGLMAAMFYYSNQTNQCLLPVEKDDNRYYWYIFRCVRPYDAPSFSEIPYGARELDNCTVAITTFNKSKRSHASILLQEPAKCDESVLENWKEEIAEGRKSPENLDLRLDIG